MASKSDVEKVELHSSPQSIGAENMNSGDGALEALRDQDLGYT